MPHVSTSKVQHSALKTFFWFVQFHFLCELHVISVPDTKKELFVFLRANHLNGQFPVKNVCVPAGSGSWRHHLIAKYVIATCFVQQLVTFWSILDQFITFHLQNIITFIMLDINLAPLYLPSCRVQLSCLNNLVAL